MRRNAPRTAQGSTETPARRVLAMAAHSSAVGSLILSPVAAPRLVQHSTAASKSQTGAARTSRAMKKPALRTLRIHGNLHPWQVVAEPVIARRHPAEFEPASFEDVALRGARDASRAHRAPARHPGAASSST